MLSSCRNFDDDTCPVPDHVLAKLFNADKGALPSLLDAIEPEAKPALVFFCYRRAHLQIMGLAIAARCDENELVLFGGRAGTALFVRSREERNYAQSTSPVSRKLLQAIGPIQSWPFEEGDVFEEKPD